ncbi:MAG: lyase family protein [Brevinematales bacterium]|nr:lyase family protein [Brevinematales bacterium]
MKKYYSIQTEKALNNFGQISKIPEDLIIAYGEVKFAVLKAIQEEERRYKAEEWNALEVALKEVINGKLFDHFPLSLYQGGAGTSLNMNLNEVIASRANEVLGRDRFDPIEDINKYQSTNDTFPTAATIYVYRKLLEVENLIIKLQEVLVNKENELGGILVVGRTEMQDALPINLGQIFGSWAGMIERDRWRIHKVKERVRTISVGGTAIGTGYPTPQRIVFASERFLREITKLPLSRSQNLPDEISNLDKYSELASILKIISENIFKITSDLLLYTSSFLNEIIHPNLQAGSTIMAAKTNPVILEFSKGCAISIIYECEKIAEYARNGQLQLNAFLPFVLESFNLIFNLTEAMLKNLMEKFFALMQINKEKIEENLVNSLVLLNALIGIIGYNKVKEIYNIMQEKRVKTISDIKMILKEKTNLKEKEIDFYLDPINITSFWRK